MKIGITIFILIVVGILQLAVWHERPKSDIDEARRTSFWIGFIAVVVLGLLWGL